jgi:hypothetical protein
MQLKSNSINERLGVLTAMKIQDAVFCLTALRVVNW